VIFFFFFIVFDARWVYMRKPAIVPYPPEIHLEMKKNFLVGLALMIRIQRMGITACTMHSQSMRSP
jgi:hypothetical protein